MSLDSVMIGLNRTTIAMWVSKNRGTPKSSILIGFSMIFTIHFGVPVFLEKPMWFCNRAIVQAGKLSVVSVDRSAEDAVQRIRQDRPQQVGFNGSILIVGLLIVGVSQMLLDFCAFFFFGSLVENTGMKKNWTIPTKKIIGLKKIGWDIPMPSVWSTQLVPLTGDAWDLCATFGLEQVSAGVIGGKIVYSTCDLFLWEQMCEMWNSPRKSDIAMGHLSFLDVFCTAKRNLALQSCFIGGYHVPRLIISAFLLGIFNWGCSSCNGTTCVPVLFGCCDSANQNSKCFSSVLSGENSTRCRSEAQTKREKPLERDLGRVFFFQLVDPQKVLLD